MTSLSTIVAVSTSVSVASISSITRISIGAVSQTVSTIASVAEAIASPAIVGIGISLRLSLSLSLADVVAAVSKTAISIGTSGVSQTISTIESGVSQTVSTIASVSKAIASPAIVGISVSLGFSLWLADVVASVSQSAVSIGTSRVSQTVSTIVSGVSQTVSTIASVAKAITSPAVVG